MSGIERALGLLRTLPRVSISNLKPLPGQRIKHKVRQGQHGGRKCGRGNKGQGQRNTLPRIGFEGNNTPFYMIIPREPYYENAHLRRQYRPMSLLQLQRMVDLGRINTDEPVDLTSLCNTQIIRIDPRRNQYGINLSDEGADVFSARINLEVQCASEAAIAAVERCGGVITTRFYDLECVEAMRNPLAFFQRGRPIPRCRLPPADAVDYYSDSKHRGYLADPNEINAARIELAQKYGYALPDGAKEEQVAMMIRRKDPRQIWFGLEPGWVVNLRDRKVLKPTDEQLKEYYQS